MWIKIKSCSVFLMVSFFLLLFSSAGSCSEGQMYHITEAELTTLEGHLKALEARNETLLDAWSKSQVDLEEALSALKESQEELRILRTDLENSKKISVEARMDLEKANSDLQNVLQSLKESERAHARTESRLQMQRTLWMIASCILTGALVSRV